jgi:hypothetical protein
MTTVELQTQISAIRESIQAQQERLDELEKQLESADELDEIDKPLEIENGKGAYFVTTYGDVYSSDIIVGELYQIANNRHRLFKSEKYAEMYREKTQHIADLLHFKWLYDRDYEPDWSNEYEIKYTVWYCPDEKKFVTDITCNEYRAAVYFSTGNLAKKCADWLNRKAGYNE